MPKTFNPYYVNISVQKECLWIGSSDFSHDGQKTENFLLPWQSGVAFFNPEVMNRPQVLSSDSLWDILHTVCDGEDVTFVETGSNFGPGTRFLIHGIRSIVFDMAPKAKDVKPHVTINFTNGNVLSFSAGIIHRHYEFLPNFAYNVFQRNEYHSTLV